MNPVFLDTLERVLKGEWGKARKTVWFRKEGKRKNLKKIFKSAQKPLANKNRFMYNSSVVCSGMKR